MRPLGSELAALDSFFKLELKTFYLGVSDGNFTTCYPYARLVFCLGCGDESFMECGGKRISLTRGTWLLLPPFAEISHHHRQSRHLSIHFSYSLLRGMELLSCLKLICSGMAPELLEIAEKMQSDLDRPVYFLNAANLIVRRVLYDIMQLPEFSRCCVTGSKLCCYNRLTDHLHRQLDPNIKVSEMAKIMNLCGQTFARKFSADTGITPRKFNENIIVDHAVELLENGELSIKEIAEKLHFTNEYYFSRFFKRSMKISPGAFRKKMRQ